MSKENIERLRNLAVATLSDGCDQIAGRRGFMDYDVKGRVNHRKIVGQAATVLETSTNEPHLPDLAFEVIDEAPEGSVIVISSDGDKNTAIWGELMNTGATVNNHEGVVLDGAVRDVELIRRDTDFPVYARSIVPTSSVGRTKTIDKNVPVVVGGVLVRPGDYIVGDDDGVVSIPAEHIEEIIEFAEQAEATEEEMVKYIHECGSIKEAVEKFGRA